MHHKINEPRLKLQCQIRDALAYIAEESVALAMGYRAGDAGFQQRLHQLCEGSESDSSS